MATDGLPQDGLVHAPRQFLGHNAGTGMDVGDNILRTPKQKFEIIFLQKVFFFFSVKLLLLFFFFNARHCDSSLFY